MKKKIWYTKKLRWMSAVLSVVMILLLIPSVSATADDGRSVEQMADENELPDSTANEAPSISSEEIAAETEQTEMWSITSEAIIVNAPNTTITPLSDVDMAVGAQQTLYIHTYLSDVESISCTVSDTFIVTAQTPYTLSGDIYVPITANQVGSATVSVTLHCASGNTETVSVLIYVTLNDGIYLIKSCITHFPTSLGDYYLRVGDMSESPPKIYASTNTYGDMTQNIYRYWRTTYAGNGTYHIRPLIDEEMCLMPNRNKVTVVNGDETWKIRYNNGGHEIITTSKLQNGEGMTLTTSTVQSGAYSSTEGYYYAEAELFFIQNMAFERWNFVAQDISGTLYRNNETGAFQNSFSATVYAGKTITMSDLGYSLVAYDSTSLTPNVCWETGNMAVATVASDGTVTTNDNGKIQISVLVVGAEQHSSYTLRIVTPGLIDDTSYYIMNYSSQRYMKVATTTDANGTNVITDTRTINKRARWKVDLQSRDYQLISVYSSAGRVLDVTGSNVDIYADNNASYQIFSIERIESGTYKGLYYIRYGSSYVAQDSSNNVCIMTSPSSAAVWSFVPVSKGNASMFSFVYNDLDTTACNSLFESTFDNLGYNANAYVDQTAEQCYSALKDSGIYVFAGHGAPGCLVIANVANNPSYHGYIAINKELVNDYFANTKKMSLADLDDNALASARCVLLLSCWSGANINGTNLVDYIYEKGAHFVIGSQKKLQDSVADVWQNTFMESIKKGATIAESVRSAEEDAEEFAIELSNLIGEPIDTDIVMRSVGDATQYLN